MAEPLKLRINKAFFKRFAVTMANVDPAFDLATMKALTFTSDWDNLELKARSKRLAQAFHIAAARPWSEIADLLVALVPFLHSDHPEDGLQLMFLPEIVGDFGADGVEDSCRAMEALTQYTTSEFAVRPFIAADLGGMMARMLAWSKHPHFGVRRWSSEGCRPLLPWAMVLHDLKADPSLILPILTNLRDDESEFVRRSVANNLNDISKNHPKLVTGIIKSWLGFSKERDALLKHGARTLLKAGNTEVMELFGFASAAAITVKQFVVLTPQVKWDEEVRFRFVLENTSNTSMLLCLEYAMYYLRNNGSLSKKVFKISEKQVAPGELVMERAQSFRPISTRRYYPGGHQVGLILNGTEVGRLPFDLLTQSEY